LPQWLRPQHKSSNITTQYIKQEKITAEVGDFVKMDLTRLEEDKGRCVDRKWTDITVITGRVFYNITSGPCHYSDKMRKPKILL